ncbi:hypothetical protein [uncultured Polaribacter sp.]|uniref:hypothetical protein n=1 Tax=uncultured Polaribacter sp. TaxID=174711 RepID=UPI00262065B4|nr:hypothetical protein [uncultured Polaribacter sp.]
MSNYRSRPKGNYNQEATWEELQILTERWKNSLEFYAFEIAFLEILIETYFVKLLLQENFDVLRELQKDISEAKKQCKNMQQSILNHITHIANIINEPFNNSTISFRYTHEIFEDEISEFKALLKVLKYTVFKITKNILESEKPQFIWKYN